ncbi:MAG: Nif3-like dinuclear metal center hexameric protein [Deltaproteobacteria bacterium]|nr:Nif3-like dinuclear metal center hexameric protein [Deltaproteobacteria bacterium]
MHPFFTSMAPQVKDILDCLNKAYPFAWASPEDRVGLQVGHPEAPVSRVLVALEASPEVIAEAREAGAEMLLTHHPLIYRPVAEIREDEPGGKLLTEIIRAGLAAAACHTNLDVAPHGLNDYLAALLGLTEVQSFAESKRETLYKLAVFVPVGYEDRVRQAMFDDRVGVIGNYSCCSFAARGQGTYLPGEGARPFKGELATLSRAEESRLEVLTPESRLPQALERLKAAHPYEEVAYDLYPLKNPGLSLGFGRLGRWPEPLAFPEAIAKVKEAFGVGMVKLWGRPPAAVERLAVMGGSGGDFAGEAERQGAQLFVTGEVRHHQMMPGRGQDFAVAEVGHFASEVVFIPKWAEQFEKFCQQNGLAIQARAATAERTPFVFL